MLIICPSVLRSLIDLVASRVQIAMANTFTSRIVWKFSVLPSWCEKGGEDT